MKHLRLFIICLFYFEIADGNYSIFVFNVKDLHTVGLFEGPWALVTPVKVTRVGVVDY